MAQGYRIRTMPILNHWALMAFTAVALMFMLIGLQEQGWQTYHWLLALMIPIWIYLIRRLYQTDWDDQACTRKRLSSARKITAQLAPETLAITSSQANTRVGWRTSCAPSSITANANPKKARYESFNLGNASRAITTTPNRKTKCRSLSPSVKR